jgi:hypothetical protein
MAERVAQQISYANRASALENDKDAQWLPAPPGQAARGEHEDREQVDSIFVRRLGMAALLARGKHYDPFTTEGQSLPRY